MINYFVTGNLTVIYSPYICDFTICYH